MHVTRAQRASIVVGLAPADLQDWSGIVIRLGTPLAKFWRLDVVISICRPPAAVGRAAVDGKKLVASAYGLVVPCELVDIFCQRMACSCQTLVLSRSIASGDMMIHRLQCIPGVLDGMPTLDD
eukprot:2233057-Amphidinium_carterae.2